jgi:hypothetical protein
MPLMLTIRLINANAIIERIRRINYAIINALLHYAITHLYI